MTGSPYWESRPDPIPGRWYWIKRTGFEWQCAMYLEPGEGIGWSRQPNERWETLNDYWNEERVEDWYLIPLPPPAEAEQVP